MSKPFRESRFRDLRVKAGTAFTKGTSMTRPQPNRQGARGPRGARLARGMTLIEILVVLVLIGVVLGIVGGNFIGKGEKAEADAARIEISQIAQTLDLYKL